MEKKNKLRAGRICVGATINSLAATSAYGYTRFPTFAIPALREMGYEKEAQLITVANPARFLSHS